MANVIVEDEFTEKAKSLFSFRKPLSLSFAGSNQNLENDIKKIESAIGKLHPLVLDLYNIALVTHICDIRFRRGYIKPRDIRIVISVSNKDRWDKAKQHLEAMLRFLTGDSFTFHFVQGTLATEDFRFHPREDKSIALFSGGLDSLAGVRWLNSRNEQFILVSHPAAAIVDKTQEILIQKLREILKDSFEWYQIRATAKRRKGLGGKEPTQRARSFLYLTLASIFALTRGIEKMYLFENGIIALNIPLTQARINENTKTAHPSFVRMYVELIQVLFGTSLAIENPFLQMTKAEVVNQLDCNGFRDLIKTTISCSEMWRLRYTKGIKLSETRHCGICFPCVIRRLSMHSADLWGSDAKYKEDILSEFYTIPERGRKILFEIMDFKRTIDGCKSLDDIFTEFPQFYVDESVDSYSLVEMTRRYLEQVKECIVHHGSNSLKQALHL
jgi:7-cyano-7-deazaguanine synthase in queuosine biosynthesis